MGIDPFTLTLAATALSAVVSGVGMVQQGRAERDAGKFRAQVSKNNAQISRNNKILADRSAADAIERGRLEEQQADQATRQLIGRQRASLAGAGVDVASGSAVDIQADTAGIGKLDALTIRSNAAREALGFRTEAMNFEQQARNFDASAGLQAAAGQNAQTAGFISAGSTILTGVGSVASKWYDYNTAQTGSKLFAPGRP